VAWREPKVEKGGNYIWGKVYTDRRDAVQEAATLFNDDWKVKIWTSQNMLWKVKNPEHAQNRDVPKGLFVPTCSPLMAHRTTAPAHSALPARRHQ
jgi:hypothetical protein